MKKEKLSPKHVFLHLFSISMLYVSTINALTLLFQFVNHWIKDPLVNTAYFPEYYGNSLIRGSLASIIIVFPLFIWSSWYLNKLYLKIPESRQMKTRRWLIYLTLFIVSLVVVGDLIRVIWVFLGGEMSVRFILKALIVLLFCGSIFGYYLWDVKREKPSKRIKYIGLVASVIVLSLIVIGFLLTGSPKNERLMRFDYQRIMGLQEIQYQIINYWQRKEKLPVSLSELQDPISGFAIPIDPESQKQYEYIVTGDNTFQLCTEFNLKGNYQIDGPEMLKIYPMNNTNWTHEAGRFCFDRTIDKELYPFIKK